MAQMPPMTRKKSSATAQMRLTAARRCPASGLAVDRFPVAALDLSGHGESDDVDAEPGYTALSAYVDDVLAVAEAVDADVLVGNSLGGAVLLGVMHATVLATAMIGFVLPVVNLVVGEPDGATSAFPGATFGGFAELVVFGLAHVVYGVVLAGVYVALRDER